MNDIILKYLQRTAGKEEKERLLAWLRESDANKKTFIDLQDIWLASGKTPVHAPGYTENAFRIFEESVRRNEQNSRSSKRSIRPFLRIAASIAILLICSIGGYYIGRNTPDIVYIEKEAVIMNQAIMGKGSKGYVTLPDGSVAWLNTNSKLTYPEKFSWTRETSYFAKALRIWLQSVHSKRMDVALLNFLRMGTV